MSNMNRLALAIEENCSLCNELKCEGCIMLIDIGDKIVKVAGKTHEIVSVKLKEEVKKNKVLALCERYSKGLLSFSKLSRILKRASVACVASLIAVNAYAVDVNIEKLADAIYLAEGGAKTSHPYGILKHYKHTTARQACINTIKHAIRDYKSGDFIVFLGSRYAPIGVANDPTNLNRNWVKNVTHFYNQ